MQTVTFNLKVFTSLYIMIRVGIISIFIHVRGPEVIGQSASDLSGLLSSLS